MESSFFTGVLATRIEPVKGKLGDKLYGKFEIISNSNGHDNRIPCLCTLSDMDKLSEKAQIGDEIAVTGVHITREQNDVITGFVILCDRVQVTFVKYPNYGKLSADELIETLGTSKVIERMDNSFGKGRYKKKW